MGVMSLRENVETPKKPTPAYGSARKGITVFGLKPDLHGVVGRAQL